MKKMFTSCLLAASAALMSGCHGNESAAPAVIQTAQARVVESQQQQVPLNVRSTGTIHARETAVVSAQVVGRIQQVLVREGDSVRAGQTLVVLDDAALRASAEQAQAGVKAAQDETGSCRPRRASVHKRWMRLHSGPRRRRQGLRQCEHRPMRRVPRRAAHTRCLAIRVCLRHFPAW